MITARDNSWRVITPPKTASTAIAVLLQEMPFRGHYTGWQHDAAPLRGGRIILSVRSPYTRAVSLWRHLLYDHQRAGEQRPAEIHSFSRFMKDVLAGKLTDFFWPIFRYLEAIPVVDALVRFEHLSEDLRTALPEYDWTNVTIAQQNHNPVLLENSSLRNKAWLRPVTVISDPLTLPDNRGLVIKWASEDFKRFSYSTEYPDT